REPRGVSRTRRGRTDHLSAQHRRGAARRRRHAAASADRLEESLQPFLEISCEAAIGYVLANEATIARQQDDPEQAVRLLDEATAHFARMGDERGEAAMLIRRGHL